MSAFDIVVVEDIETVSNGMLDEYYDENGHVSVLDLCLRTSCMFGFQTASPTEMDIHLRLCPFMEPYLKYVQEDQNFKHVKFLYNSFLFEAGIFVSASPTEEHQILGFPILIFPLYRLKLMYSVDSNGVLQRTYYFPDNKNIIEFKKECLGYSDERSWPPLEAKLIAPPKIHSGLSPLPVTFGSNDDDNNVNFSSSLPSSSASVKKQKQQTTIQSNSRKVSFQLPVSCDTPHSIGDWSELISDSSVGGSTLLPKSLVTEIGNTSQANSSLSDRETFNFSRQLSHSRGFGSKFDIFLYIWRGLNEYYKLVFAGTLTGMSYYHPSNRMEREQRINQYGLPTVQAFDSIFGRIELSMLEVSLLLDSISMIGVKMYEIDATLVVNISSWLNSGTSTFKSLNEFVSVDAEAMKRMINTLPSASKPVTYMMGHSLHLPYVKLLRILRINYLSFLYENYNHTFLSQPDHDMLNIHKELIFSSDEFEYEEFIEVCMGSVPTKRIHPVMLNNKTVPVEIIHLLNHPGF